MRTVLNRGKRLYAKSRLVGQGGKTADWLFISRVLALSADQSKAAQVN